jgi:hypothetical protein
MWKWRYSSTILNIGIRGSLASFTPRSLHPQGKCPVTNWTGHRVEGPSVGLDAMKKQKQKYLAPTGNLIPIPW